MLLLAMFQDCEDSDCVVKCRGAEFKVYQSTLRKASPLLDVYFGCCSKKGEKEVLLLHDFRVYTVQALLEFMYCANYSLGSDTIKDLKTECETGPKAMGTGAFWNSKNTIGQKNLVAACMFHMTVGIAARYYGMNSLDDLSRHKFEISLSGVEAEGLAQVARNADRLTVDLETRRLVARAVVGAMQNDDNKHDFKYLDMSKMSEEFRKLLNENLACRLKAEENLSKRLQGTGVLL
ncbi:unnamed protein product [Clonostachys chloroleuca]|uniref:BTB domain-containing protein n=1 Tax=Clonostachys chloroleuca TaxID=1926264 RepID=A0AA35QC24_9HYPO|nr:unnamed protein product [Clonostachys chloroleuca]